MPPEAEHFVLILSIFALLSLPIVAILRVRFTHWSSSEPKYRACSERRFPRDVDWMMDNLEDLGFVIHGLWQMLGHSHSTAIVVLAEHPQTLDLARIAVVAAGDRREVSLSFQSIFADGKEIWTANSRTIAGLPGLPNATYVWLPELREPRSLYRIHEQVRDRLGSGKRSPALGSDAEDFLVAQHKRNLARFVETGYYFRDEKESVCRPTLKGAALMIFRLMWPMKVLYRARRRQQSRDLLRELGIDLVHI